MKIKDLTESDNMLSLTLLDYEKLYKAIGNQIIFYKENNPITIADFSIDAFDSIANTRWELYQNICRFCEINNLNIVIETANFNYNYLKKFFDDFYKYENYLLSYYFDSNSEEMKKFNYRNVLLRGIFEGRFLDFNFIKQRFQNWNQVYRSYSNSILDKNIRKLNLTFKFKINFNFYNYKYNVDDIIDYVKKYNSTCIDMGNFEYYDPIRIDKKKQKDVYTETINDIVYDFYCIKNKKLEYKEEIKDMKYKNICTDYVTKFLLNESNSTYIINNTIKVFDEIINILFNRIKLPEKIEKTDFKIVFKGRNEYILFY